MQSRKPSAWKSAAQSRKSPRTFLESCRETCGKQRIGDGVNRTAVCEGLGRLFVSIVVLHQQCLVANLHALRSNNAFHLSAGYTRSKLGSRMTRIRYSEVRTLSQWLTTGSSPLLELKEGLFTIEKRMERFGLYNKAGKNCPLNYKVFDESWKHAFHALFLWK